MFPEASGNVYVSGAFTNSNGKFYVAKWNGTGWSELGGSNSLAANNSIGAICSDPAGNIYAGGNFTNSNGKRYIAKWNSSTWSELGGNNSLAANDYIQSMNCDVTGNVYVTGAFTNSSGKCYMAKWSGNTWIELSLTNSSMFTTSPLSYISFDSQGNVYTSGFFIDGANYKRRVIKWNGSMWSEVGGSNSLGGVNYNVNCQLYGMYVDKNSNKVFAATTFPENDGGKTYLGYAQGSNLPVSLVQFTSKILNSTVLLNWQTANEVNVSHFNIQRSNNGKEFTTIGKVNAGNKEYSFIDAISNLELGIRNWYYRLEIVDKDGTEDFKDYPVWVAHYTDDNGPNIDNNWTFWQHSESELVKSHAGEGIINNPAIPNEQNDAAVATASSSIFDTLKNAVSGGNIGDVVSMFTGGGASATNSPLAGIMHSDMVQNLMHKFGLDQGAASNVVSSVLPGALSSLVNKTNDPNDSSFNIQDIISKVSGGSGGFDVNSLLGGFTGGDNTQQSGGGIMDGLKGLFGG
ncbi:unnamed protein product [Rotaria sp. Silwood1]|nr:unnamed protein product [Rotaria sp. Silwood1]